MERCPSCWFHRERSCRDGPSADGPWFPKTGRLRMARGRLRMAVENTGAGCGKDNRHSTVCRSWRTSWRSLISRLLESLDTASDRRVAPAEIVEVIEIAAPLPAELASPMFVTASARVEQDRLSRQRDCVSAWAPRHKRDVTDGMRFSWKILVVVVS